MKRLLTVLLLTGFVFTSAFAEEGGSGGVDFTFSLGGTVQYESPILAGGTYNEEFAAENKEFSIDDFLLGLELRADWMWDMVGLRLDLMAFYNPTADYTALGDAFTEAATSLSIDPIEELEHGIKFVFNPMFNFKSKFVGFSVGPGVTFGWNITQGVEAIEGLKSGDAATIAPLFERIGLDPADYATIADYDGFKEALTFTQQVAFFGGELDFNLKGGIDFYIGKITIGVNYIWDLNSNLALWDENADFSTNMSNIIKVDETKGFLGASVLYSF